MNSIDELLLKPLLLCHSPFFCSMQDLIVRICTKRHCVPRTDPSRFVAEMTKHNVNRLYSETLFFKMNWLGLSVLQL